MTMTVVHANGDQAQIMTDGIAYNEALSWVKALPEVKATVLEGITTAVASRGCYVLGQLWLAAAVNTAARVDSFDELAEAAPMLLRANTERGPGDQEVQAYAVGWSPAADGFRALVWDGLADFACEDITGTLHVTPAPVGCPPTAVEQRVRQRDGVDPLPEGKPAPPPRTDEQWQLLAKVIHNSRAKASMSSRLKVPVGGDVTLTTLTRSGVDQRVIHRFTSDDFEAMVAGSLHPMVQLRPCGCGSGQRWVDCCLSVAFDRPCACGSGETFGNCCRVDPAEATIDTGELAAA